MTEKSAAPWEPNVLNGNPLIYEGDANYMDVPSPTTLRWRFIKDDLHRQQANFMRSIEYTIWAGTWNVNGQDIAGSLYPWLGLPEQTTPDIIFISLQEMDRRPEAYLMAVSSKEAAWNAFLLDNIQQAYNATKYALVVSRSLVGIYAAMFIKEELCPLVSKVSTAISPCGLIGMVGNKGAVGIRAKVHSEYVCFISSHLAPHVGNVWRRNRDYADLSRRLIFPVWKGSNGSKPALSYEELLDKWNDNEAPTTIWDCGLLIWTGDLNYRISLGPTETLQRALQGDYDTLLLHDQLKAEIAAGRAYQPFLEEHIDFPPTFKYGVGTDSFDKRADPRPPAWTDRVLYRSTDRLKVRRYTSAMSLRYSDHKPVSCLFAAEIKSIDSALFETAYSDTLRRLDQFENETIPMTIVSRNILEFGEIVYMRPGTRSFELLNTGQVIARFCFIQRPDRNTVAPPWVKIRPTHGIVYPGYSVEVRVLVLVEKGSAAAFNKGEKDPDDILILHIEGGKDHFISIEGQFRKTCFCRDLTQLSQTTLGPRHLPNCQEVFGKIPEPISILTEHLVRFGMQVENLFLESGDPMLINEIQDLLDANKGLPEEFNTEKHMHSAAEVLLRFLDSLPDPVVPGSALQDLSSASPVALLLQRLPDENANLCRYLLCFIKESMLTSKSELAPELAMTFARVFLQDGGKELDRLGSILTAAMK